jgi:hypothetical protein
MRFCCADFPLLELNEIFVNDIVEPRQHSLVDVTFVCLHVYTLNFPLSTQELNYNIRKLKKLF